MNSVHPNKLKLEPKNVVNNQKYTVYSFVPKVIYYQLRNFANLYFFVVMVTQIHRDYAISPLACNVLPWVLVLLITMLKEGVDDYRRHIRDRKANSELYAVFRDASKIVCSELKVGDLVYLNKGQRCPADCVLLWSDEESIFIRTDQLDGETDWKLRTPVFAEEHFEFEILVPPPSKDIYMFEGSVNHGSASGLPNRLICLDNTIWMNTYIESGNSCCIIIYTAPESRAMLNTSAARNKIGKIDEEINTIILALFILSLVVSIVFALMRGIYNRFDITVIRFLVIFSNVIPISLKVSIETARYYYAYILSRDQFLVRNSNIPEELGRIGYLLTDKTGTLTCNTMIMRKIHLGNTLLFASDTDFICKLLFRCSNKSRKSTGARIKELVVALSVAHNVIPHGEINKFQAASPDEVAIIEWLAGIGVVLKIKTKDVIGIEYVFDGCREYVEYKILYQFAFSSKSKRMGIIVMRDQKINFYCKGADNILLKMIKPLDWVAEECDNLAREGLRTLLIAGKELSPQVFSDFENKYKLACGGYNLVGYPTLDDAISVLESDLDPLGITGVEDKLQDDVKNCLESLKNAGIRVWMLTGDKPETARCIALSSRLFSRQGLIYTIEGITDEDIMRKELAKLGISEFDTDEMFSEYKANFDYLIVDGESLRTISKIARRPFIGFLTTLSAIILCRCSPLQKADITAALKAVTSKRVACIGDGGNDVSMILEAHIGLGIYGKEGMQASLSSDISVSEFKDIIPLFFWHGRNCYSSTAMLTNLIIHRGTILSVMQGIFCALMGFCPFTLYQGMLIVGYVTLYTLLPFGATVLDFDLTLRNCLKYPELYHRLNKMPLLGIKNLFSWNLVSFYQGSTIMLASLCLFDREVFLVITITFSSLIINELLMVLFLIHKITWMLLLCVFVTFIFYGLSFFVIDELELPEMNRGMFFLKLLAINIFAISVTALKKLYHLFMKPPVTKKLV